MSVMNSPHKFDQIRGVCPKPQLRLIYLGYLDDLDFVQIASHV